MKVSETRKTNKYVALVTYLIAIVCLLLGLFLPLFNGNQILALRLPGVLNNMAGRALIGGAAELTPVYTVNLFGLGIYIDLLAYALFLYVVVTLLGLLALIPIGFSFKKDTTSGFVFEHIIETAAVLILSFYMVLSLALYPASVISYNMVIAFGGPLIMLLILCCNSKGKAAAAKTFLFIFSIIAAFLLFDISAVIPELKAPLDSLGEKALLYPGVFNNGILDIPGITYVRYLFSPVNELGLGDLLKGVGAAAHKTAIVVSAIAGLLVLINFAIDVFSLCTRTRKAGLLFNIVRYGLELLSLICLLIVVPIAKLNIGLFLIVIAAIAFIQTLISVLRFVIAIRKAREAKTDEDFANQTIRFAKPVKQPKPRVEERKVVEDIPAFEGAEPIVPEPIVAETIATEPEPEQMAFIEPAPSVEEKGEEEENQPLVEHPDEVQMEIEEVKPETVEPADEPEEVVAEETVKPADEASEEVAEQVEETEPATEAEEPVAEEVEEPATETETVEVAEEVEAVEEVTEQATEEIPEPVSEPEEPVAEEVEEPATETETVEVAEEVEAVEEVAEQATEEIPEPVSDPEKVEPAPEPAPAPIPEPEKVEPAKPVIPVVIEPKHEVRTAQVVQRPYIDKRIYAEMYEQTDGFINKLSETEKQEFTRTFIEKANGDLGNIPDYIIGGNNKKFFSAVFIYLGRVRGMISDGLLNKMFKELNMM